MHIIQNQNPKAAFAFAHSETSTSGMNVKRTPTGAFLHIGYQYGNSAYCNGRSGNFSSLTRAQVARLKPEQFCEKCAGLEYAAEIIAAAKS